MAASILIKRKRRYEFSGERRSRQPDVNFYEVRGNMDDQYQQRMRNIMVAYNVIAIFFALWIQTMDMYHSWGNIRVSCN